MKKIQSTLNSNEQEEIPFLKFMFSFTKNQIKTGISLGEYLETRFSQKTTTSTKILGTPSFRLE